MSPVLRYRRQLLFLGDYAESMLMPKVISETCRCRKLYPAHKKALLFHLTLILQKKTMPPHVTTEIYKNERALKISALEIKIQLKFGCDIILTVGAHKNKYQQYCVKTLLLSSVWRVLAERCRETYGPISLWRNISVAFLNGDFTIIVIEL
jgi:hypothetical protein